jgi:hypothetical protein
MESAWIFDRALSASAVKAMYHQARTGYPDLLNWQRAWSFGADAGGGGVAPGPFEAAAFSTPFETGAWR